MKILVIRQMDFIADSRVTKESNSLLKGGHEVSVLDWDRSKRHPPLFSEVLTPCGTIHRINFGFPAAFGAGPRKNLQAYARFTEFIKKFVKKHYQEYDAFHLCDLSVMFPLFRFLKRKKKIVVYDIFDYYPDLRNWPSFLRRKLVRMESKCINSANAVLICSENRIKQIGNAKPKRLAIVHNAPDIKAVLPAFWGRGKDSIKICYFGFLSKDRFTDLLLSAIESNSDTELAIGGSGPLQENVLERSKINPRIHYFGQVPYSRVLALESASDLLVALYDPAIPNNRYAAPNKFYESLSLGKPLVMIKGTGFDDFFQSHRFGVAVSPTTEGISLGIAQLVNNKKEWPEFRDEEVALFSEKYSWSIMEKRLLDMYSTL